MFFRGYRDRNNVDVRRGTARKQVDIGIAVRGCQRADRYASRRYEVQMDQSGILCKLVRPKKRSDPVVERVALLEKVALIGVRLDPTSGDKPRPLSGHEASRLAALVTRRYAGRARSRGAG
jgi:hypothetical protein